MQKVIPVFHSSDVGAARLTAKELAAAIGFDEKVGEEIAIVVSELASNLVEYAKGGTLTLTPLAEGGRVGIQIESYDCGPGIADVEQAMGDGFSTAGSLGNGLGAVNRLLDELAITSRQGEQGGTHLMGRRWVRGDMYGMKPCPMGFGAATRPHPRMNVNGDAFVIKRWGEHALVAVIDGLGHGQFAHRAAQEARHYVETHFDQPLASIFCGVGRTCRATRGVVMALARFDWARAKLSFASVGNVEVHVFGSADPTDFIVRRGIVGANAPNPVVTEHRWDVGNVLVLHSDGVKPSLRGEDFAMFADEPPNVVAQRLLCALAKDDDDATVVVVKKARERHGVP